MSSEHDSLKNHNRTTFLPCLPTNAVRAQDQRCMGGSALKKKARVVTASISQEEAGARWRTRCGGSVVGLEQGGAPSMWLNSTAAYTYCMLWASLLCWSLSNAALSSRWKSSRTNVPLKAFVCVRASISRREP